ncbi:endolytic transglycosylase MltG [Enterobacteriaceae endosymbiont of Macroplea appendiculata]|nr:endolytic transglycosylase MltG [Enterobacteriaceae endosymbiont of Macroplea appendiculata]
MIYIHNYIFMEIIMSKINVTKIFTTILYILYITVLYSATKLYQEANTYINIKNHKQLAYIISPQQSINDVLNNLQTQNIINKNFWLYLLLQINPDFKSIQANIYYLKPNMKIINMLALFHRKQILQQYAMVLIEGETLTHFLKRFNHDPYLKHTFNATNLILLRKKLNIKDNYPLEGRFSAATYFYTKNTTDLNLLKIMFSKMNNEVQTIWTKRQKNLPYHNFYEMIIAASIIEKETANIKEKYIISSILMNRLKKHMKLQMDSTILYGTNNKTNMKLLPMLLKKQNKYNTYIIYGLPPSAISTPSKNSLLAAAHPIKSDFLYFVADKKGKHIFNKNFHAHKLTIKKIYKTT